MENEKSRRVVISLGTRVEIAGVIHAQYIVMVEANRRMYKEDSARLFYEEE